MAIVRNLSGKACAVLASIVLSVIPDRSFPQLPSERLPEQVQHVIAAAEAAREAGDGEKERAILEKGIETIGPTSPDTYAIYHMLGQHHADRGNFTRAAEVNERQLLTARSPGQELHPVIKLVSLYSSLHRKKDVASSVERLDRLEPRLQATSEWARRDLWRAGIAWARAHRYAAEGHLEDAEDAWKTCLSSTESQLQRAPDAPAALFYIADCTAGLMRIQMATGELAAAGAVADRQRLAVERLAQTARRPAITIRFASLFGQLAVEQGRLDEARRIYTDALETLRASNAAESSFHAAVLRRQLAMLEMLQQRWDKALEWHQQREIALQRSGTERGRLGTTSLEYAYTLQRLGRVAEAVDMVEKIVTARNKRYDEDSLYRWEGIAFRGIALAAAGRREEALKDLSAAIPKMLDFLKGERISSASGVLRTTRLNWLLEGYLTLLSERAGSAASNDAALDEAFRIADLARGSSVQRALAASAVRAAIADQNLATLARREQDLQWAISALAESLGDMLERGQQADQDSSIADMRVKLAELRVEHGKALAELERGFPDYAALLDPKPVGIAALQGLLKPTEALVSYYVTDRRTLIWTVSANAPPRFAAVPLGREELDRKISALRRALDPDTDSLSRMPPFDFALAHELYKQLLAPVEAGWKDAQTLIVVPHGRLGQLPFGVLTTQAWTHSPRNPRYSEMADAPWLLKQNAIAQLPSALALRVLRTRKTESPAGRPFIGFGDPIFNEKSTTPPSASSTLARRARIAPTDQFASTPGSSAQLGLRVDFNLLAPLPDTAAEIQDVAGVLAADRQRDVFLGKRASETAVKTTDLSDYRVVMFATHGLMKGDMPGLYQPALALSNPRFTDDREDGILTMREILGLKLRADWVVLSACNSGAPGDPSGESISGLGRAFFYAGAKSLLVTHWAVETASARLLTTDTLRQQMSNPSLSRAQALQHAALALMKKTAGKDYSYAHPMFWAPYALVGDGS